MLPLRDDLPTRSRYSQAAGIERIVPRAVARPHTRGELAAVVAWAEARDLPVTPRGAGSAMDGSSIGAGLVLDLTALDAGAPVRIDPVTRLAVVAPGLSGGQLAAAAAPHGLRFGPDPSSLAWATVGGMIGTNAAGARSYRLGAVDRWVEAIELWTTDGPLELRRGVAPDPAHPVVDRFVRDVAPLLDRLEAVVRPRWPRTRKNTAGYGLHRFWSTGDLLDLVIGSEGTLGPILGATLRLEPIPTVHHTLEVVLQERAGLGAAVEALAGAEPVAIELLDASFLRLVGATAPGEAPWQGAGAVLLVDVEGSDAAEVGDRIDRARAALAAAGAAVREASSPEGRAALWNLRHRASPILAALADGRRSLQVIEDGCVPPASLDRYLAAIQAACDAESIDVVMFGHAGDGHVHVNLLPDLGRPDWLAGVRRIHDRVLATLRHLGGTPAGEHGAGRLRAPVLGELLGPEAIACFAAIKSAFDPAGRWNPGVILSDGSDPFQRLKLGDAAEPLAPGVAEELAELEARRGYGRSRWDAAPVPEERGSS
ncbi:MAG: FAD-binding oxidoreductase [Gemmatimonadales bacterium]